MTTGQIDKILSALTELRVAAEARFAALEAKLDHVNVLTATCRDHEQRLQSLEIAQARTGRLSWSDIGKFIAALAAVEGAIILLLRN